MDEAEEFMQDLPTSKRLPRVLQPGPHQEGSERSDQDELTTESEPEQQALHENVLEISEPAPNSSSGKCSLRSRPPKHTKKRTEEDTGQRHWRNTVLCTWWGCDVPPILRPLCQYTTDCVNCPSQGVPSPRAPRHRAMRKSLSHPGLCSLAYRREFQDGNLRSCSFFSSFKENGIENHLISGHYTMQPTDTEENRTALFTSGQSEVYLISPDTKKTALEKSFKEISFSSQGIRHMDHFGFICQESSGGGGFHFVCSMFQCTNEALVDKITMTVKQAFMAATVQQRAKAPAQLCEACPLQGLHKFRERTEGMNFSKTKLELQTHLTTLTNQEQATICEEVQKLRPRNEQQENKLIISFLRCLYEEKQKEHIHIGEIKQTPQITAENTDSELPTNAPRFMRCHLHENLETTVDFIKNTLPSLGLVQMQKTISQVFEMDIAKQLQAYEVEYCVLQEELIGSRLVSDNQRTDKLEKTNSSLRKQNLDLLEQLQVAHGKIQSLEAMVEKLLTSESKLKQATLALEVEQVALLRMMEELRRQPAEMSTGQPEPMGDRQLCRETAQLPNTVQALIMTGRRCMSESGV
ncbi:TBC1 domain family member 1 [Heterocephalus glaber]|uniref:TBC1 domain family member 1 n=1 Tax=Heterocephalus glaber TaxID=10181 RepID=G5B2Q2_HETGA|nr:TBC1 domain family member 1 [Heterocephalus glaber]